MKITILKLIIIYYSLNQFFDQNSALAFIWPPKLVQHITANPPIVTENFFFWMRIEN
jgi:hypothetical protein